MANLSVGLCISGYCTGLRRRLGIFDWAAEYNGEVEWDYRKFNMMWYNSLPKYYIKDIKEIYGDG
ncbi:MAG: hypothetical protein HFE90_10260 [Firmicutes bacterium]|nr:hypothetical protein [Bacillota bacterium]